ncbi:acyltransferase [Amycolatopsis minnesotensis]|uniref:Acyltransferase n=1 Tax=Amycolatopsis minnesotensis TaxID=337894 RepID=A0ABP5CAE2_9PSEU
MTAAPATATRLPSLTGYRVPLSVAVFLAHSLSSAKFFESDFVNGLGLIAPYGIVSLSSFFVLSGFVLTWAEPWRDKAKPFWRRRLVKIFPNHVLTWALTLTLLGVVGSMPMLGAMPEPGPALANLALIQSWIPNPGYLLSVDGINWSVSCELLFYLILPFLARPLLRIPAERLWFWFIGLGVAIAALPAVITYGVGGQPWALWPPLSFVQTWLVYFFPVARLPEFLLGVVLARIVQTGRWPRIRARWVALATVLLWLLTFVLPPAYSRSGLLSVPISLFVPILAMRDIEGRSGVFGRRSMVVLGNATYATYLVHWPLLGLTRHLVGADRTFGLGSGLLIVCTAFVVTQVLGFLLYQYFELPLMRRYATPRRGRSTRRGHPAPP